MKTYVSHINGRDYLYAYDRLFIARGKTIQKTKSLGPVDTLTDLTKKKQDFARYIQKEEERARISFWKEHVQNPAFTKYVSVEKLEQHRTALFRAKKDMGPTATGAMESAFLVDFIYNSNKLEGSKLPRESVERQVRNQSAGGSDEVRNTLKALYFVDTNFEFTPRKIEKLHAILLAHEPANLGFRKEAVVVGNAHVCPWGDILKELRSLCTWYTKARKSTYPPELAFDFYYRFERIHPFLDGNGRTGRLIMNRILKEHRYHPIIIWNKRREAHLSAFQKRMARKPHEFYKFMAEQFIKTHDIYLEKIAKAIDFEKLSEFFMQPSAYNMA